VLKTSTHDSIIRIQLARTILGRPFYTVAAYLVDGLLIDSGPPFTARQLIAWLQEQEVRQVVNTHHHEDHSGGTGPIQRALRVPVAVPAAAVPLVTHFPQLELYRRIVWGQPAGVTVQALGEVVKTAHHHFQVIPTPGHCPDHVCFYEPEQGWLFSGDLFIHERAHYLRRDEDLDELMKSLQHVLTLRPKLLVCSHTGVIEDACGAIERKIAYWEQLRIQAQTLRRSDLSVHEVTGHLLGGEGWMTRVSGGHMSKINLVRALLRPTARR
jgi:glyoxylase-like metal-dependent hydrolase (beta-lactamase superfamily II)